MAFSHLIARLGDWASWDKFQTLAQNYNAARLAFLAEHNADGLHNNWRVPRAKALCLYDDDLTNYVFQGEHPGITSVSKVALGTIDVLFDDATWTDEDDLIIEVTVSPLKKIAYGVSPFSFGAQHIYYATPLYTTSVNRIARIQLLDLESGSVDYHYAPGISFVNRSFFLTAHHNSLRAATGGIQALPETYLDAPWLVGWLNDLFALPDNLRTLFATGHHAQTGKHLDKMLPRGIVAVGLGDEINKGNDNLNTRREFVIDQTLGALGVREVENLDTEGQCRVWWENGMFATPFYGAHVEAYDPTLETTPEKWQFHTYIVGQTARYIDIQTKVWSLLHYNYENMDLPFLVRAWAV